MPNNIALTGDKYSGKSTIIKEVIERLNLKPGGFVVGRTGQKDGWLSFYLVDPLDFYYHWQGKESTNYKKKCQIFARRDTVKDDWDIFPEVFDNKGVSLLDLGQNYRDLVIMDELGRFELRSKKFQTKVIEILKDQKPVLVVIKDEENMFLNKVKKHIDHKIYRVKDDNRELIFNQVLSNFKQIIR